MAWPKQMAATHDDNTTVRATKLAYYEQAMQQLQLQEQELEHLTETAKAGIDSTQRSGKARRHLLQPGPNPLYMHMLPSRQALAGRSCQTAGLEHGGRARPARARAELRERLWEYGSPPMASPRCCGTSSERRGTEGSHTRGGAPGGARRLLGRTSRDADRMLSPCVSTHHYVAQCS